MSEKLPFDPVPSNPFDQDGQINLRVQIEMSHPDYNLDLAWGGRGKIVPNRNAELEKLSTLDFLLDAKKSIELDIENNGTSSSNYRYSGFMIDSWERAIKLGMVVDEHYVREDFVQHGLLTIGHLALLNYRSRKS